MHVSHSQKAARAFEEIKQRRVEKFTKAFKHIKSRTCFGLILPACMSP
jgi:hypothetical protein